MKVFDWISIIILAITLILAEVSFESGDVAQAFFTLAKMALITLVFIFLSVKT